MNKKITGKLITAKRPHELMISKETSTIITVIPKREKFLSLLEPEYDSVHNRILKVLYKEKIGWIFFEEELY